MRIFKFWVQEGFEWASPIHEADYEILRGLDGTRRASEWRPIPFYLFKEDEHGRLRAPSDMPWLSENTPILKDRAVAAVGELFARYGELLPLECEETPLTLLNVCNVIDALDMERSKLVHFRSGRIMDIEEWVFKADAVGDNQMFKIAQMPTHIVYVNEDVVTAVQRAELEGVGFQLVWDGATVQR
jgi:hypothetical protein